MSMNDKHAWYAPILGTTMNGREVVLVLPSHWNDVAILIAREDDEDRQATNWVVAAVYRHQFERAAKTGVPVREWDGGDYDCETWDKALARALYRALDDKSQLALVQALVAKL